MTAEDYEIKFDDLDNEELLHEYVKAIRAMFGGMKLSDPAARATAAKKLILERMN